MYAYILVINNRWLCWFVVVGVVVVAVVLVVSYDLVALAFAVETCGVILFFYGY